MENIYCDVTITGSNPNESGLCFGNIDNTTPGTAGAKQAGIDANGCIVTIDATADSLTQNTTTGIITDGDGISTASVTSADANNLLTTGSDGGSYLTFSKCDPAAPAGPTIPMDGTETIPVIGGDVFLDEDGRTIVSDCAGTVLHRTLHADNVHAGSIPTPGGPNLLVSHADSDQTAVNTVTTNHDKTVISAIDGTSTGAVSVVLGGTRGTASGTRSITLGGLDATASGTGAIAGGRAVTYSGNYGIATGITVDVSGNYNQVTGEAVTVTATRSTVSGFTNIVDGNSHGVFGRNQTINNQYNVTGGLTVQMDSSHNIAVGQNITVATTGGAATADTQGRNAVFGLDVDVVGQSNLTYGNDVTINGGTSVVGGRLILSEGSYNLVGGRNTSHTGLTADDNVLRGLDNTGVDNTVTYAIGRLITLAAGVASAHAYGQDIELNFDGGFAFGSDLTSDNIRAGTLGYGELTTNINLTNTDEYSVVIGAGTDNGGLFIGSTAGAGLVGVAGSRNQVGVNMRRGAFASATSSDFGINRAGLPTSAAGLNPGEVYIGIGAGSGGQDVLCIA